MRGEGVGGKRVGGAGSRPGVRAYEDWPRAPPHSEARTRLGSDRRRNRGDSLQLTAARQPQVNG